jgi:hypothetical protein
MRIILRSVLCLCLSFALSFTEEFNKQSKENTNLKTQSFIELSGRHLQDTCNEQTTQSFQIQVVLDMYGKPHLLSQEEKDLIGEKVMLAYNEQVYCIGTNFRQIDDVTDISETFVDRGVRDFSLSYIVSGSCQGCSSIVGL